MHEGRRLARHRAARSNDKRRRPNPTRGVVVLLCKWTSNDEFARSTSFSLRAVSCAVQQKISRTLVPFLPLHDHRWTWHLTPGCALVCCAIKSLTASTGPSKEMTKRSSFLRTPRSLGLEAEESADEVADLPRAQGFLSNRTNIREGAGPSGEDDIENAQRATARVAVGGGPSRAGSQTHEYWTRPNVYDMSHWSFARRGPSTEGFASRPASSHRMPHGHPLPRGTLA